jgi:hypothetical protein
MSKLSIAVSLTVAALSITAFAGKREREVKEKDTLPAMRDAEAKWKSSCGCTLTIDLNDSLESTTDELRNARSMARDIGEHVEKYCTDASSKKALCQMKTMTLTKGKPVSFTFKDGHGVLTADGQMYAGFDQMTKVLDK